MARVISVAILSDVHYASAAEQARGPDYELRGITNPATRLFVKGMRRYVWLRDPLEKNHLLDRFMARAEAADYVVANGDYACDTAFVGVSDDAARQSAQECLSKLRDRFGERFRATIGDHELGKFSFVGGRGGMRLQSYQRARSDLNLEPFWQLDLGRHALMGVASSLIALPVYEPDTLPEERLEWERLREEHFSTVRHAMAGLDRDRRVILFCHDPSALPFLWRDEVIRSRLNQVEQTIIGHLHSNFVFWKSRMLAGFPRVRWMGHSARRMSAGLSEARYWRHFQVRLCPSLAGIELLKDGGFLMMELEPDAVQPARFRLHRLSR